MVHYLQQANYIPALQLNHSLRMNQVVRLMFTLHLVSFDVYFHKKNTRARDSH